ASLPGFGKARVSSRVRLAGSPRRRRQKRARRGVFPASGAGRQTSRLAANYALAAAAEALAKDLPLVLGEDILGRPREALVARPEAVRSPSAQFLQERGLH